MKTEELRPCPFCGSPAYSYHDNCIDFAGVKCDLGGCVCADILITENNWNTRPIEDALIQRIAELEAEVTKSHELQDSYCERIAELSQAVGLITTLKPTMVMDTDHPLEMAIEVAEYVTARIAELEGFINQLTAHDATERQDDKWIPVSERLPEDLQSIIVFTKDRKTYIIRFLELYGREGFGSLSDIVTHWMPLPVLPESPNDTQTQTVVYRKESEE